MVRSLHSFLVFFGTALVSLALSVNAQTVNVRGKVTDAAGKALAGVNVELVRAKLTAATGADGAYSLASGTGITRHIARPGAMRLDRGALELTVDRAAPLRIGIYDVKGHLLDEATLDLAAAGSYRLDLAGRVRGNRLRIIKATVGNLSGVFPYFPSARGGTGGAGTGEIAGMAGLASPASLEYLGPAGPAQAKQAAFLDTLKAAAAGYQTRIFAINSYDLAQDIVLETEAGCAVPTPPAAKDAVTLDMAVAEGPPNYLASGFIYGISEDGLQPPNALLSDIKVKNFRAGRGTSGGCGEAAWKTHWKVMKAYYAKAKALGGSMLLLVSDNYQYSCPLPGEGGDWGPFTTFMAQFIDSVKANGMTGPDVRWELWNEADYAPTFWTGTQAQWLDTWKHAYQQVRAAIPSAVIEGPSFASGVSGAWMNAFLDYAKANDVVPDIISWHIAGGGGDPERDVATLTRALATRGITGVKGFDLNEYGSRAEQNPGHSAWFLARFDRTGIQGMRSNWAGGSTFFSNMGDLVAANWQPNSQYWIYKRYADQTGLRIKTTAGTQVDALGYQDRAAAKSILIVGNRGGTTGAVNVVVRNVPSWLQNGGKTQVLLEKMPTGTGASSGPTVVSDAAVSVTCNSLIVTLDWSVATDGYVLTLTPD